MDKSTQPRVVKNPQKQLRIGGNPRFLCYNRIIEARTINPIYRKEKHMNTIGQNIAYFRKQKKLTQEELAEKMSVTAQAVSKWECDTSYPDITVMQALAKTLGVSVDNLLEGERAVAELREASAEIINRRIMLIRVDTDESHVITRIPVNAVKKAIDNGVLKKIVGEETFDQVVGAFDMADDGFVGTLVEVNHEDVHVRIAVENYED